MSPRINKTVLSLCFSAFAFSALASPNDNADDDRLVTVGDLHFSVALGLGEKTNPLVGGDDIPLYVVPSLRYYGESFYFDNGDLGYTLYDQDTFAFSLLTRVNNENAYFSRWHPKNVFVFEATGDASISSPEPGFDIEKEEESLATEIDIQEIRDRKWALDAGVQLNWFVNEELSLTTQLLHDVNGVYSGLNGKVEAFYAPKIEWSDNISLQFTAGFDWASESLVDYYYGIDKEDTPDIQHYYDGSNAINPYAKIFFGYKIDEHWKAFFSVNYKALDDSIKNSPIVKDSSTLTSFIGVSYVF